MLTPPHLPLSRSPLAATSLLLSTSTTPRSGAGSSSHHHHKQPAPPPLGKSPTLPSRHISRISSGPTLSQLPQSSVSSSTHSTPLPSGVIPFPWYPAPSSVVARSPARGDGSRHQHHHHHGGGKGYAYSRGRGSRDALDSPISSVNSASFSSLPVGSGPRAASSPPISGRQGAEDVEEEQGGGGGGTALSARHADLIFTPTTTASYAYHTHSYLHHHPRPHAHSYSYHRYTHYRPSSPLTPQPQPSAAEPLIQSPSRAGQPVVMESGGGGGSRAPPPPPPDVSTTTGGTSVSTATAAGRQGGGGEVPLFSTVSSTTIAEQSFLPTVSASDVEDMSVVERYSSGGGDGVGGGPVTTQFTSAPTPTSLHQSLLHHTHPSSSLLHFTAAAGSGSGSGSGSLVDTGLFSSGGSTAREVGATPGWVIRPFPASSSTSPLLSAHSGGGQEGLPSPVSLRGHSFPQIVPCDVADTTAPLTCAICLGTNNIDEEAEEGGKTNGQASEEGKESERVELSGGGVAATHHVMVTLEVCRHSFHQACLQHWLLQHRHCPLCRRDVVDGSIVS